jgi:hypothetical integral membrane protein (TIGR02206 family)
MSEFFSLNYSGAPFELFGPAHLVALSVVVALNLAIVAYRWRFNTGQRRALRYTLAAVLLINESLWHLWNWTTGQWTIQTMLPLHLCSLLVFLSAYLLVTRSYAIYEFVYFLGIAGASQALLTPDAGVYGFPHFRFFQVIISHGAIITTAIYMSAVEGYRPTWRSIRKVLLGGNLYLLLVGLINWMLGSNYLFIAHKPETASLLDVLGPWPWYILVMEALALVMTLLLYLPYVIKDWNASRSPQPAH